MSSRLAWSAYALPESDDDDDDDDGAVEIDKRDDTGLRGVRRRQRKNLHRRGIDDTLSNRKQSKESRVNSVPSEKQTQKECQDRFSGTRRRHQQYHHLAHTPTKGKRNNVVVPRISTSRITTLRKGFLGGMRISARQFRRGQQYNSSSNGSFLGRRKNAQDMSDLQLSSLFPTVNADGKDESKGNDHSSRRQHGGNSSHAVKEETMRSSSSINASADCLESLFSPKERVEDVAITPESRPGKATTQQKAVLGAISGALSRILRTQPREEMGTYDLDRLRGSLCDAVSCVSKETWDLLAREPAVAPSPSPDHVAETPFLSAPRGESLQSDERVPFNASNDLHLPFKKLFHEADANWSKSKVKRRNHSLEVRRHLYCSPEEHPASHLHHEYDSALFLAPAESLSQEEPSSSTSASTLHIDNRKHHSSDVFAADPFREQRRRSTRCRLSRKFHSHSGARLFVTGHSGPSPEIPGNHHSHQQRTRQHQHHPSHRYRSEVVYKPLQRASTSPLILCRHAHVAGERKSRLPSVRHEHPSYPLPDLHHDSRCRYELPTLLDLMETDDSPPLTPRSPYPRFRRKGLSSQHTPPPPLPLPCTVCWQGRSPTSSPHMRHQTREQDRRRSRSRSHSASHTTLAGYFFD